MGSLNVLIKMITLGLTLSLCLVSMAKGQEVDPYEALSATIPGEPGEDYPIFAFAPDTSFLCDGQIQGYYADPEADCQSFHICPNGTLFNQQYFICDWWFNVDCSLAESFYSLNEEIAEEQAANTPEGAVGVGALATGLATSYLPSYPDTPPTQGSGIQPRRQG